MQKLSFLNRLPNAAKAIYGRVCDDYLALIPTTVTHSYLSATIASTVVARLAGTYDAASITTVNNSEMQTKVIGSFGVTP